MQVFLEKGFGLIFGVLRGKCKLFLFLFMRKFHVALIFCELVINILFCFMYVRSKCDMLIIFLSGVIRIFSQYFSPRIHLKSLMQSAHETVIHSSHSEHCGPQVIVKPKL